MDASKPGARSSEFWLSVAAIAVAAFSAKLGLSADVVWGILGVAGVYTGGRSFVKGK